MLHLGQIDAIQIDYTVWVHWPGWGSVQDDFKRYAVAVSENSPIYFIWAMETRSIFEDRSSWLQYGPQH